MGSSNMKLSEMVDAIRPLGLIASLPGRRDEGYKLKKHRAIKSCIRCNCYSDGVCKEYLGVANRYGTALVDAWLSNSSAENGCFLHNRCAPSSKEQALDFRV